VIAAAGRHIAHRYIAYRDACPEHAQTLHWPQVPSGSSGATGLPAGSGIGLFVWSVL
jgi:hypothetical protein